MRIVDRAGKPELLFRIYKLPNFVPLWLIFQDSLHHRLNRLGPGSIAFLIGMGAVGKKILVYIAILVQKLLSDIH